MSRLVDLKTELAKENGYKSYYDFIQDNVLNRSPALASALISTLDVMIKNYAREVAQASLEKASENAKIEKEYSIKYQDFIPDGVDKDSITNEDNIILL